jgi:hypothetical protein
MSLSVVNLGLPKSGTTTLAQALARAGLKVADHRLKEREEDRPGKRRVFVANLLYRGYFQSGDPMELMPEFDAISEMSFIHGRFSVWPQCDFALLGAMRDHHPGMKFIATRRDAAALSASMMNWNNLGKTRLPASHIPGLPPGFGATEGEQMRWIEGHYRSLRHWFRDDPDFLELDVAAPDAQARVAALLGRDLPWWGQANVNRKARTG